MNTTKTVLAIVIGIGLTLGATVNAGTHPGETVDFKSLPAAVQEAIKQHSAGGEVVKVVREDDPDGKWNYEVVVKSNGKESHFEVDPNGKLVKQHGEAR
jgi:uncharacterized membrane protein YkoI